MLDTLQGRLNRLDDKRNNYSGAKAQCWIDAGHSCGALLEHVAQRSPHAASPLDAYLQTILAHRTSSEAGHKRTAHYSVRASERLSARERAVLVLVAKGQSNKHAARTLKVTPETIKSHLKRVFVKLGAKTRAEAVSRAADLGQLVGVVIPVAEKREHPTREWPRATPLLAREPIACVLRRPSRSGAGMQPATG